MVFAGTTTFGTTGIKSLNLGFKPALVQLRVCAKYNTPQTFSHLSLGESDSYSQQVTSTYQDTTGGYSKNDLTKVVSHYERVGGVITEVLSAEFHSFTASGVKINVLIGNPNYQVILTAWS